MKLKEKYSSINKKTNKTVDLTNLFLERIYYLKAITQDNL